MHKSAYLLNRYDTDVGLLLKYLLNTVVLNYIVVNSRYFYININNTKIIFLKKSRKSLCCIQHSSGARHSVNHYGPLRTY